MDRKTKIHVSSCLHRLVQTIETQGFDFTQDFLTALCREPMEVKDRQYIDIYISTLLDLLNIETKNYLRLNFSFENIPQYSRNLLRAEPKFKKRNIESESIFKM